MSLSTHDKDVLSHVFNPEHPKDDEEISEHMDEKNFVDESLKDLSLEIVENLKCEETNAVKIAEAGDHLLALNQLTDIIARFPNYASTYNNRAQVHRLLADNKAAFSDLDMALTLTKGHGIVACQAYTQRGILYRLEEDSDKAVEDLRKAAALGGKFAKQMLIEMNPYAALCNQMLNQVINQLKSGTAIE